MPDFQPDGYGRIDIWSPIIIKLSLAVEILILGFEARLPLMVRAGFGRSRFMHLNFSMGLVPVGSSAT